MARRHTSLTPTQTWQALVPELTPQPGPADTAERLLLLLHYAIDWNNSWVAQHRKTYWDEILPGRVTIAAYRCNDDLERWWTLASTSLDNASPRQPDRRRELAILLREPSQPVIAEIREKLPARLLAVRIIVEANREARDDPQ